MQVSNNSYNACESLKAVSFHLTIRTLPVPHLMPDEKNCDRGACKRKRLKRHTWSHQALDDVGFLVAVRDSDPFLFGQVLWLYHFALRLHTGDAGHNLGYETRMAKFKPITLRFSWVRPTLAHHLPRLRSYKWSPTSQMFIKLRVTPKSSRNRNHVCWKQTTHRNLVGLSRKTSRGVHIEHQAS